MLYNYFDFSTYINTLYTNISFKEKCKFIEIKHNDYIDGLRIPIVYGDMYSEYVSRAAIFEGKNIGLNFTKDDYQKEPIYLIFVKGENVIINLTNRTSENTCIFAKNIYVSDLSLHNEANMILIGENIFIEDIYSSPYSNNAYIFAKNVISIGRPSLFPPFSKEKLDSWINDKTYSCGTIDKTDRLYLSAPQYLYDSQKRGNSLNPLMAKKMYNAVKKSYLNWTSNPSFYSASRKPLGKN